VPDGTGGKVAGAALSNVEPDSLTELAAAADRLHSEGFNTVSLDVWWEAASAHSDAVAPYAGTVSDGELENEISVARSAGLSVDLTPLFYCSTCQGGFRGVLQPAHPAAFFASYDGFVEHYAAIAQAEGVGTFFLGSEMSSLEGFTAQWEGLISSVRRIFHGRLSYEENWDVLGRAQFFGALDDIGVSAYFPLDPGSNPSLAQLLADWRDSQEAGWKGRNWVAQVAALVARYHRPVLFGEAGYMSGDYAAANPYLNFYGDPNPGLQADLYQALLETFQPYGWWAGVVWWDWEVVPDGPALNGRTFQGKGAEMALACWYGEGMRPDSPDSPLP
jgi:hypothetical protein